MAKTKISEYDSTAANNTDVDSVNIAEGCAPSGINNAIREVMSHLKDFQTGAAGDSLTVGGNFSVTGTVTIPDNAISGDKVEGGTINAITINTLTAGQVNFADNAKAIFGTGGDLEIYHTGNNSFITDVGTGSLYFEGATSVNIRETVTGLPMAVFTGSGSAALYHSGIKKFETTSTGIDVTGTVVADGLTVDGLVKSDTASNGFRVLKGSGAYYGELSVDYIGNDVFTYVDSIAGASYNGSVKIRTANNGGSVADRVRISSAGVSFYEDTGTTPKFFWDASAESLGIGTSSPSALLHLDRGATAGAYFYGGSNNRRQLIISSGTGDSSSLDAKHDFNASGVSGVLSFSTNNIERMRIDSAGDLLVKTADARIGSDTGSVEYGTSTNNSVRFYTSDIERLRIDGSSGNVGIGTSAPSTLLDLRTANGVSSTLRLGSSSSVAVNTTVGTIEFYDADSDDAGIKSSISNLITGNVGPGGAQGGNLLFSTALSGASPTERMRITSGGDLLVGTTDSDIPGDSTGSGVVLKASGRIDVTREGVLAYFNRTTSDGAIVEFRKNGTEVGSIGTEGNDVWIGNNNCGLQFIDNTAGSRSVRPFDPSTNARSDNTVDLGQSTTRFDDIYATNGTIQTSDRNEKQDIEVLSEAEARVAVACKGLLRKFRWKDSVAEKGDEARIHFGIIAQDLQDAFAAEGLDAGRYAMFISSTWWEAERVVPAVEEVLDDEGNVVTEAVAEHTVVEHYYSAEEAPEGATERTRLGVRYPELLAFIIAAI